MEENDSCMDEIFNTRKSINKNTKHKTNKINYKMIFIIFGIIIVILISCLVIRILIQKKPVTKENLVYKEFDPLVTKTDDETFYIFGAKSNISFEVIAEKDFNYQVLDKDNKEVNTSKVTKNNNIVISSDEPYTEGKTYTIIINNGSFTNYKNAKKIIFSIARPALNEYTLKENIITLDNPKIENNVLKTDSTYKENDIIAVTKDTKIISIYKIKKENSDGTYELTTPKLDEVFSSIDYYGMEKLNLSTFIANEEVQKYLINTITNQVLNSLVNTVYAKENIEITSPKWNQKTQSLTFSIIIDAKENTKLFENNMLKEHQTKTELYISVKCNLYKNINLDSYDYALSFEYTINNKVNLISTNDKIIELNDNLKNDKKDYDASWLLTDYSKITNDKVDINKSIGKITVPTEIPGLNISFDLNFIMNTDIKAILDGNVSGKINTVMGINSNKEIYGSYNFNGTGIGTITGDGNTSLGFNAKASIHFIDANLESDLNSLMYVNSKSEIKEKDEKDNKIINYKVKADIGYNGTYNLNANINNEKLNKKITEIKETLKTYEKQMEFIKVQEKKDQSEKTEFKYTADEVKKKLTDAYNEIGKSEEWTLRGGAVTVSFVSEKTIDVDNNKFITKVTYDNNNTYTCSYDYLNQNMNCTNFEEIQNYIKNACDNLYNDYLNYQETGECDNDDAMEWENLYDNLNSCYYETIPQTAPTDYKTDISKILNQAKLTEADLEVLK